MKSIILWLCGVPLGVIILLKVSAFSDRAEMAANSQIKGVVEYRVGDGPMLEIPLGPCEIELAADSAVISWDEDGEAMRTAIPLEDYERYAKEGEIERPTS